MTADSQAVPKAVGPSVARESRLVRWLAADWLTARRIHWLAFAGTVATALMSMVTLFVHAVMIPGSEAVHFDFSALWAASVLTLQDTPALAYDVATHRAVQEAAYGSGLKEDLPWLYPPLLQLIVLPLGLMPLVLAKLVWTLATGGLYLAVAWRILPGRTTIYVALAPCIAFSLFLMGQTGFLTAGLTGLGLLWWHSRPGAAGVALGLLSLKPQLALGVPLAAVAGGHWRVFLMAAASVLGLTALSLGVLGAETWRAFLGSLGQTTEIYRNLDGTWHFYASAYGGLRMAGLGFDTAMAVQAVVSLAAGIALVHGFRDGALAPDAKMALLAYGTIAISPRVMEYDLLIVLLGALFQVRHARARGLFPGEKLVLLLAMLVTYADFVPPALGLTEFLQCNVAIPPLMLAALLVGERYRPANRGTAPSRAASDVRREGLRAQAGRLLRFGIVGVGATLTHVLVLSGLVELAGTDPRIANLVAFGVALPVSYLGHYHWSFGSTHPHGETLLRFVIVALSSLIGSQGLMILALDVLGAGYGVGIVLMIVVMPLVNFAVQQALVFRRKPRAPAESGGRA